ncbi:MAG: SigB/SigF/SigG family RNA polymerase sigma factor [Streptosporangiaceae bacterium]
MVTSNPSEPRAPITGTEPGDSDLVRIVQSRPKGDPDREAACETLIARYQNLVRASAQHYRDSPESAEELMQVGYVGLLKAINNFDPAVGDNLAAYAQPCISGEIKRYFRDKRWQVRVRRPVQERRLEIRNATAGLTQQLGRIPTDADLASHLHISEDQIREAQLAAQAFQAASLDAPLADSRGQDHSLSDVLGAEDPDLEHTVDMEAVRAHWAELPEREQHLLMLRFYGNMTQDQIGQHLGISQMHVSRLLTHALTYLRERITDPRPGTASTEPTSA